MRARLSDIGRVWRGVRQIDWVRPSPNVEMGLVMAAGRQKNNGLPHAGKAITKENRCGLRVVALLPAMRQDERHTEEREEQQVARLRNGGASALDSRPFFKSIAIAVVSCTL